MVVCAGEALFDFISKERRKSVGLVTHFEKRPGGAPLNVAVGLARLGNEVKFLGKVSKDPFGAALLKFMEEEGISTEHVLIDESVKTTLAFVSLDEEGKPSFVFYREKAADSNLKVEELPDIEDADLYHFGSISVIDPPSSQAFLEMFRRMKRKGVLTSFDPNIRPSLVSDWESYRKLLDEVFSEVDILKLSEEDLENLGESFDGIVKKYSRDEKITVLTLGGRGSVGHVKGKTVRVRAFKFGKVVDTTGCGDAYMSGLIHVLVRKREFTPDVLKEAMEFASIVAGVAATRKGAASSMPRIEEIENLQTL